MRGIGDVEVKLHALGIRWKRVVSFTLQPLYLRRNSSRYSLERRQGSPPRAGLGVMGKSNYRQQF
jgi:hypothetical protein